MTVHLHHTNSGSMDVAFKMIYMTDHQKSKVIRHRKYLSVVQERLVAVEHLHRLRSKHN